MNKIITLFSLALTFLVCSNLSGQVGDPPPYTTCDGDVAGAYMPIDGATTDDEGAYVLYSDGSNAEAFTQMAMGGTLPDNSFIFDVFTNDGMDTTLVISENYVLDVTGLGLEAGDYVEAYSMNYDLEAIDAIITAVTPLCGVLEGITNNPSICSVFNGIVDEGGVTSLQQTLDATESLLGTINAVSPAVFYLDTLDQIIQNLGPVLGLPTDTRVCFAYDGLTRIDIVDAPTTAAILGCTDPEALNYNADATEDDDSCEYETTGVTCAEGEIEYTITVDGSTDSYPSEISWDLVDAEGTVLLSGACGTLTDVAVTESICLTEGGTYTFNAYDDWGDGWNGGTYSIVSDGATLYEGVPSNAAAGDGTGDCAESDLEESIAFTAATVVSGCTDPEALNYNADANTDDDSCEYPAFECGEGEVAYTITVDGSTDQYPSEISWDLVDAEGTILLSGACGTLGNETVTESICLTDGGTYTFNAYDDWGDGWNGGTYTIEAGGETLYTGTPNNETTGDGVGDCAESDVEASVAITVGDVVVEPTCEAMSGTTMATDADQCDDGMIAAMNEGAVVPEGFILAYVLTQGEDLVILDFNTEGTFEVGTEVSGLHTIHSAVIPEALDLTTVVTPGETTGGTIAALLVENGGTVCASLDVAGTVLELVTCEVETTTGTIEGTVYTDANENGTQDEEEAGIADVEVSLLDAEEAVLATTTTDENGDYTFADLTEGDYAVAYDGALVAQLQVVAGATAEADVAIIAAPVVECFAASGSIDVAVSAYTSELVFANCETVQATPNGNNTDAEYTTAFLATSGDDFIIEALSFDGAFALAEGTYTVHVLNVLTADIAGVDVAGLVGAAAGDVLAILDGAGACYELNAAGGPTAGTVVTILPAVTVQSDHECSQTEDGVFTESFVISGGLPSYSDTFTYVTSGDVNFDDLEFADAQSIIVSYTDNAQVNVVAADASNCDAFTYQPVYGPCIKLALELVYFRGEATEAGNQLTWATATEFDNDYFTVQASEDGNNFYTIGTVNAKGESNTMEAYSFTDVNAKSGITYYILTATDVNGLVDTFDAIEIARTTNQFAINSVNPTPAISDVVVNIDTNTAGNIAYEIFDLAGKLVEGGSFQVEQGNMDVTFDISNFNTGIYLLNINNGVESVSTKIVKR